MHDVFISYSTKDMIQAEKVRDVLEQNGIPCWMAPRDIPGGSNYAGEIPKAIRGCQVFLLILSENAQNSLWVVKELDNAVNSGKIIMPLMLEDCPLNDEFNFLLTGAQRYAAYCRSAEVLNLLVERIRAITGTKTPTAPEAPAAPPHSAPKPQAEEKKAPAKEAAPVVRAAKPEKPKKVKEKIPFAFGKTEALAAIGIPVMAALSVGAFLLGNYYYFRNSWGSVRMESDDYAILAIYILLGAALAAAMWWEWVRFRHKEAAHSTAGVTCPSCAGADLKVSTFRTRRLTWVEKLTVLLIPLFTLLGLLAQPFMEVFLLVLLDSYWTQIWTRSSMYYTGTIQGLVVGVWLANFLVRRLRRRKGLRGAVCRCKSCRASFLPVIKAK